MLTASDDGTACIWDAASGRQRGEALAHRSSPASSAMVRAAAFSPDGSLIATGDHTGAIRLWSAETGQLLRPPDSVRGSTTSIHFSPTGDLIAASFGAPANVVRLWNTTSGALLWERKHDEMVRGLAERETGCVGQQRRDARRELRVRVEARPDGGAADRELLEPARRLPKA